MHTYSLHRELFVPLPLHDVFEFFSRPENLGRITPPWMHFELLTAPPVKMQQGAVIGYRIRVRGVPMRWRTEIESWEPPHAFVDIQAKGPYRYWRHQHRFFEAPGGTSIVDDVEYALPFGWLGRIVHRVQVARDLARIFDYRSRRVSELLLPASRSTR
jgi:ligand-binding SRPBCC domain-containing protein